MTENTTKEREQYYQINIIGDGHIDVFYEKKYKIKSTTPEEDIDIIAKSDGGIAFIEQIVLAKFSSEKCAEVDKDIIKLLGKSIFIKNNIIQADKCEDGHDLGAVYENRWELDAFNKEAG